VEEMIKEALDGDKLVSLDVVEFNELLGNPQ
jgi:arginase family enzyme